MHQLSSDQTVSPFSVASSASVAHLARDDTNRFEFRVPWGWRAPAEGNPFASEAERQVLEWLGKLGCSDRELERVRRFDTAGYVGIPFPSIPADKTVRIAKFISLWLLWDDVHVETQRNRWRIDAAQVLAHSPPDGMTRFDKGWWQLMEEFAAARSARWIEELCRSMVTWNAAAAEEAVAMREYIARGVLPSFARQLALRIATIGMEPTVYLLEDAYDFELPREFHEDPRARRLKDLASEIVGLGNDILSLGKDLHEGQFNLVTTLMHERNLLVDEAIEYLFRANDAAMREYDRLADEILQTSTHQRAETARWLQGVRFASLGFTLWEAQAPRYTAYKVVSHGVVLEPSFRFEPCASRRGGRLAPAPR